MSEKKAARSSSSSSQSQHVRYDAEAGMQVHDFQTPERAATASTLSPSIIRKRVRTDTVKTFTTVQESPLRPNWHPGQEPGLDTSKPNGGRAQTPTLHEDCRITVVDFSEENIQTQQFGNRGFIDFLGKSPNKSLECRWISVNGLSWDVISALGNYKGLHRLSIEDLVNVHNRTKADWYTDHTCTASHLYPLPSLTYDRYCAYSSKVSPSPSGRERWIRLRCREKDLGQSTQRIGNVQKVVQAVPEKQTPCCT